MEGDCDGDPVEVLLGDRVLLLLTLALGAIIAAVIYL